MKHISLAIHGGAGTILPAQMDAQREQHYRTGLQEALDAGYRVLESGGTALLAVESAVVVLENNELFNAGRGSVFAADGRQEMDAAIMDGHTLQAGAVCGVSRFANPIQLARAVMVHSPHVLLSGTGAEAFALEQGFELQSEDYFYNEFRYRQWQHARSTGTVQLDHSDEKKFGTVGAVALDVNGHLAAATSTGGMTNKRPGRVGDSPLIGCGTYANDCTCAVSCTGDGEFFIRAVAAYDISCLIEYKGLTLQQACEVVIKDKMVKLGGEGGAIAVNAQGEVSLVFNTTGMYRAWRNVAGQGVHIWRE